MTSPNSTQIDDARAVRGQALATTPDDVAAPLAALFAPVAIFSVVCDSLHLLSAFTWGKEGRLSSKNSAKLCDLMNAWN